MRFTPPPTTISSIHRHHRLAAILHDLSALYSSTSTSCNLLFLLFFPSSCLHRIQILSYRARKAPIFTSFFIRSFFSISPTTSPGTPSDSKMDPFLEPC